MIKLRKPAYYDNSLSKTERNLVYQIEKYLGAAILSEAESLFLNLDQYNLFCSCVKKTPFHSAEVTTTKEEASYLDGQALLLLMNEYKNWLLYLTDSNQETEDLLCRKLIQLLKYCVCKDPMELDILQRAMIYEMAKRASARDDVLFYKKSELKVAIIRQNAMCASGLSTAKLYGTMLYDANPQADQTHLFRFFHSFREMVEEDIIKDYGCVFSRKDIWHIQELMTGDMPFDPQKGYGFSRRDISSIYSGTGLLIPEKHKSPEISAAEHLVKKMLGGKEGWITNDGQPIA